MPGAFLCGYDTSDYDGRRLGGGRRGERDLQAAAVPVSVTVRALLVCGVLRIFVFIYSGIKCGGKSDEQEAVADNDRRAAPFILRTEKRCPHTVCYGSVRL